MGNIISILFKSSKLDQVKIDFESAEASEKDRPLIEQANVILEKAPELIERITNYSNCAEYIQKALSISDDKEIESIAFEKVSENVIVSKQMFELSKMLEEIIPNIFRSLKDSSQEEKLPSNQQALYYKLVFLFEFILKIDQYKMLQPGIQNDFAFYRRKLPKHLLEENLVVTEQDASFVSMFLAQPCSMMSSVCKAVQLVSLNDTTVIDEIANMANTCLLLIKERKFDDLNSPNYLLCLRTMVACIVIYDSVSTDGVFAKSSPVSIKSASSMLAKDFRKISPDSDLSPLINIVRYSCPHYNDDTTPNSINQILSEAVNQN